MQLVCDGCYEGKEGVSGGLEGSFVCREGISRGHGRGKGRIGECLDGLACGMEYLWDLLVYSVELLDAFGRGFLSPLFSVWRRAGCGHGLGWKRSIDV